MPDSSVIQSSSTPMRSDSSVPPRPACLGSYVAGSKYVAITRFNAKSLASSADWSPGARRARAAVRRTPRRWSAARDCSVRFGLAADHQLREAECRDQHREDQRREREEDPACADGSAPTSSWLRPRTVLGRAVAPPVSVSLKSAVTSAAVTLQRPRPALRSFRLLSSCHATSVYSPGGRPTERSGRLARQREVRASAARG